MFAYFRAPIRWTELVRRTVVDTFADGVPGLAAQLAFYFLLALFPALLFVIALLSQLPIEPALAPVLARLDAVLPRDVLRLVREQLDELMRGASGVGTSQHQRGAAVVDRQFERNDAGP